ncbi:hypothetical protein B9N43_01685 [Denitratisoma sp. DHT3]|uniref:hypothetical protein n=1 Tax=Denitratisoma sp. DHT3 TaxID=1981880 RepID=UPI00119852C2|nr:hypothetical protein [Denitratisoma sp. DHT3]QDX80078.1 hypothetical protein B9N43_01685 [Denitratisoma sp. DHT3]
MSEQQLNPLALRMLAWACLWSPLAENDEHQAAWEVLQLPGDFEDVRVDYWNAFHAGVPQPPVPALFHALLQREGNAVREDLMRAADYLELEWSDKRLPPDHVGPACEIFGLAIEREEPVLIDGLRERYLRPWSRQAQTLLASHPGLLALLERFEADVAAAPVPET